MSTVFIALGSNLGDRRKYLEEALAIIGRSAGVQVVEVSSFLESDPVGGPSQPKFLNAAARIETALEPLELLAILRSTEERLGRVRGPKWGPRVIDLDLLLYEDRIVEEEGLTVPHPLMHLREFVLRPLAEIAPDAKHPVLKRTVAELLAEISREKRN